MNNRSKAVIHIANTPTSKVLELRARLDKALKAQRIHGYSTNLITRTKKVGSITVIFKYNYKVDSMSFINQELSQYGTVEGYEPQQSTTPIKLKSTTKRRKAS